MNSEGSDSETTTVSPSSNQRSRRTLAEYDALWGLVARVLGFFVGITILMFETLTGGDHLYVTFAAIGLCGPVVAQATATVFAGLKGTPPQRGDNGAEQQ